MNDPMANAMRRSGRRQVFGGRYLLTAITAQCEPLFDDWEVGREVVRVLRAAECTTLAFVVMPDRLHWLVELRTLPLAKIMRTAKSHSALAVNRRLRRVGPVWQTGYIDQSLQDADLEAAARLLLAQPLKAQLVEDLGRYPLWDAAWM